MQGKMKHLLRISVRNPERKKELRKFRNKLQDVQNKEDQVIFGRQRCEEF